MKPANLLVFFSSFVALSLEILGTQSIFSFFPQSSQALSISLSSFFVGLALASYLSAKHFETFTKNLKQNFSLCFIVLTGFILFYLYNFSEIIAWGLSNRSQFLRHFLFYFLCGSFLFIPALLLGFVFPIVAESLKQDSKSRFGYFNAWDLLGAIGGSLFVGFVFIPLMGLKSSFILMAGVTTFLSLFLHFNWRRALLLTVSWAIFLSTVSWNKKIEDQFLGDILFQKNSDYGVVSVAVRNNNKSIYINYREMCSTQYHPSEKKLAELALAQMPSNEVMGLNIGLGCGFTAARFVEDTKVRHLDIAEINPIVAEANKKYFGSDNQGVLEKSNVRLILKDGLAHVSESEARYDVIVVDIEEPTIVHSSALYTIDGFQKMKEKMTERGVLGLWSFEQKETAKIILNSLRTVFRHAYVYPAEGRTIFFAADRELHLDLTEKQIKAAQRIEETSIALTATVANNPYSRFYRLENIFPQPKDYRDPFELIEKK